MCPMITYPNLYYLKYFADAVELESVSAAAQRNLVSHPAVSRAISNLEKHLGVELLEHRRKSFKVTDAGYQVAKQARALLLSAKSFNSLHLPTEEKESVRLSVGISRSLTSSYLGALLKDVKTRFPDAEIQVQFGTTVDIAEAVAKRLIDVGITIGTQRLPTLKQTAIRKGKYLLIESGASKELRENWESKSFILTEPRFETETLKQNFQKQFGSPLPRSVEVRSWEVICQLVREGLGVGLVPDVTVQSWKKEPFRILRPSWFESGYEVYAHHLKQHSNRRITQYVVDWLIEKK